MRLSTSVFACLAATAAPLTAFRPLSSGGSASALSRGFARLAPGAGTPLRATHELAAGWVAQVDESSGETFYMNRQTGEAQWDPPQW